MPSLKPVKGKVPNKYSTFVPEDPSQMWYQGGLTLPSVTGRPHMGPGNWVSPDKSPFYGDEKYRQHDLGYSDITNSYFNYNEADAALRDAPYEGPADIAGKGVFVAKDLLDNYRVPSLYVGGYGAKKKDVNYKYYYDSDKVPFRDTQPWLPEVHDTSYWGSALTKPAPKATSSGARKKDFGWYDRTGRSPYSERSQFVDNVDQSVSSRAPSGGRSGRKHDYKVRYEYS